MAYGQAILWLLVGLILIFRVGRENRVFYLLGAYFLFLGVWSAAGVVTGVNLFAGMWAWYLRGITAVVLVAACVVFCRQIKKDRGESEGDAGRK